MQGGPSSSILVVESDGLLREAIADALRVSGYGVRTAVGGPQAAGILLDETIDVVLADLDMPARGFGDLVRALDRLPNVSVICFAGEVSPEIRRHSAALRAKERLEKPLTLATLLRHVRRLGRGRSAASSDA